MTSAEKGEEIVYGEDYETWHFYLSDEDRSTSWASHSYVLQFVAAGMGSSPQRAWEESVASGRVPEGYDQTEPPTVAIRADDEREVELI